MLSLLRNGQYYPDESVLQFPGRGGQNPCHSGQLNPERTSVLDCPFSMDMAVLSAIMAVFGIAVLSLRSCQHEGH